MSGWSKWEKGEGKGNMKSYDVGGEWIADVVDYPHSFYQYIADAHKHFGQDFEVRVLRTKTQFKVQFKRINKPSVSDEGGK